MKVLCLLDFDWNESMNDIDVRTERFFFTISEIQIKIMKGAVSRNLSNSRNHHQTE